MKARMNVRMKVSIKASAAGLALGMFFLGTSAYAEPIYIESDALTLSNGPAYTDDRVSVLASSGTILQLSLTEMLARNNNAGSAWSAYDDQGNYQQAGANYNTGYQIAVHSGYRITSIEWNLTFAGQLQQATSPLDPPGQAVNRTFEAMQLTSEGNVVGADTRFIDNLNGTGQLQFSVATPVWYPALGLELQSGVWMAAQGIPPNGILPGLPSFASLNMTDAVLTIHTVMVPVPEPSTYAMLLGGLALVGVLGRRRRG
ncbi:PEP-CTERM sorting domain-containing protein [Pseudoduganella buxea]|uniref:Ice-binding protein C-terminal domain-containing protein n=1 Tax=Pseudoduganella buxea TaxID=1949069 RepID=A0ABQ1L5T9_9BURK|nr:PEP-CTERM sorting domain-containing protein [Pseudoduganella buxea]GGC18519.1 hypothetical protein GCM10011572_44940 [Pseudoduganella buxea]